MAFSFDFSDELKAEIPVLAKRDKKLAEMLNKKVREIIASDEYAIEHYKNLRHGLSEYKRVHIGKHFVLLFKVFKKENFILFDKFAHHDHAYK